MLSKRCPSAFAIFGRGRALKKSDIDALRLP
jgi:hypothetical protein